MDYQRVYDSIIKGAKLENRKKLDESNFNYQYFENHHIIPKCLGGTNSKENLVLLTPREHYVCHKLLSKIYNNNIKIQYPFYMMSTIRKKRQIYNVSSRDYEYAKKQIRKYLLSDEVKEKKENAYFNKKYSKEKISAYLEDLKTVNFSPNNQPSLKIKLENNKFKSNVEHLKKNIEYYNSRGCIVPIKSS